MLYFGLRERLHSANEFDSPFNPPCFMAEDRDATELRVAPQSGQHRKVQSSRTESGRSRLGPALPFVIRGTGGSVPDRTVANLELEHLGCDSQWIIQRTGIRERRWADASQASSDLAYIAALRCLEQASVDPSDVDLVIVATITPDHATPSTACILQKRLGCIAAAMDINAACSGFMYALVAGAQFIHTGSARNALIVGAEVMSRTINPADVKTFPLFGDGAGAFLLQPADFGNGFCPSDGDPHPSHPGILAFTLGSEGSLEALCTPGGGSREPLSPSGLEQGRQFMQMDGRSVFKWAVRCVVDSCRDILASTGYQVSDIDWVILHQANTRIIDSAMHDLGFDTNRVIVNLDRFGNTSAASIPLAIDEANRMDKLERGDLILMCGFGAGLTWGTALVRW